MERELNTALSALLESVGDVYLPQRDGLLVESLRQQGVHDEKAICEAVFAKDIEALRDVDVIVAVLDGRALDEGVCIELGYGKALGAYIVGFKSDIRTALPWGNNPMVTGCVDVWVSSSHELGEWIAGTCES